MIWIEGVQVELPGDVGGSVGAQDIEGEAAQAGEVSRFGSDAALVFAEGDVADVVAAGFDAPVLADGGTDGGGGQADLRRIEGRLAGFAPKAGSGVLVPGEPGDKGGGVDQAVPVGSEAAGDIEALDVTMLLSAMSGSVDGLGAVGGFLGDADRVDCVEQGLLVGFDLDDEEVSGIACGFKGF